MERDLSPTPSPELYDEFCVNRIHDPTAGTLINHTSPIRNVLRTPNLMKAVGVEIAQLIVEIDEIQ
jgi:hypothetical protein